VLFRSAKRDAPVERTTSTYGSESTSVSSKEPKSSTDAQVGFDLGERLRHRVGQVARLLATTANELESDSVRSPESDAPLANGTPCGTMATGLDEGHHLSLKDQVPLCHAQRRQMHERLCRAY
jgi:hypothetical protein